jgi:hypothetical protein
VVAQRPPDSTGHPSVRRAVQVFMIWRPAARLAMGPFPPARFDDRFLAATILAPRVLFATVTSSSPDYFPLPLFRVKQGNPFRERRRESRRRLSLLSQRPLCPEEVAAGDRVKCRVVSSVRDVLKEVQPTDRDGESVAPNHGTDGRAPFRCRTLRAPALHRPRFHVDMSCPFFRGLRHGRVRAERRPAQVAPGRSAV